jgi:hypothetical protein
MKKLGFGSYVVKSPSPTFGLGLRPDPPLILCNGLDYIVSSAVWELFPLKKLASNVLGIHIFSHGKGLDQQCNDNTIQVHNLFVNKISNFKLIKKKRTTFFTWVCQ